MPVSLHRRFEGVIRKQSEILPDVREYRMDAFDVAFWVIVALCLGGTLCIGAVMFLHIRRRRERLQMKRHIQTIEAVGWNEVARRT
jgi:hypothetical protein